MNHRTIAAAALLCGMLGAAEVAEAEGNGLHPGSHPKPERQQVYVHGAGQETVRVPLMNGAGQEIGCAILSQADGGVRVEVLASGLSPGRHGFHLHEKAFERADFAAAGAHYNPDGRKHGFRNPKGYHAGDMYNLEAAPDGRAHGVFLMKGVTLAKGEDRTVRGRSLIIHAGEDDYFTDPAGNSGDRIAGGSIR